MPISDVVLTVLLATASPAAGHGATLTLDATALTQPNGGTTDADATCQKKPIKVIETEHRRHHGHRGHHKGHHKGHYKGHKGGKISSMSGKKAH